MCSVALLAALEAGRESCLEVEAAAQMAAAVVQTKVVEGVVQTKVGVPA
jgi:hypothetical protein